VKTLTEPWCSSFGCVSLPAELARHPHPDAGRAGVAVGTFAVFRCWVFSINTLSLFGLVLAIGPSSTMRSS
jgi:hypothetical protein